jgi:hypothetical protein
MHLLPTFGGFGGTGDLRISRFCQCAHDSNLQAIRIGSFFFALILDARVFHIPFGGAVASADRCDRLLLGLPN